jgi:ligand-binding SRPBCC domain-containing protein
MDQIERPCSPLEISGIVLFTVHDGVFKYSSQSQYWMLPNAGRVQRHIVPCASAARSDFGGPIYSAYCFAARCHLKTETFVRRSRIAAPAAEVYAWHALPGALEQLTPPEERAKILEKTGGIERGARVVIQFGRWPFSRRWVAEHQDCEVGRYFSDVQVSGPFAYWKHTHTFEPDGPSACILEDRVEYALPFGVLGRWFAGWYVRRKLDKLFEYRHNVTAREVGTRRG